MATAIAMPPVPTLDALDALPALYSAPGTGNCMVPVIPANTPGLTFDKRAIPQPGDVVVLWFTPEAAARIGHPGWVKRLVKPLPPRGQVGLITVEMLNPHRVMTMRSDDVLAVHKCIAHANPISSTMSAIGAPLSLRAAAEANCPIPSDGSPKLALTMFQHGARLPLTHFVHMAQDDFNAPLIRAGEVVVVDQGGTQLGGWMPTEGGLFLIEYRSDLTEYPGQRYPRVSRSIVQTFTDSRGRWHTGPLRRGIHGNMMVCTDGPYADEERLAAKLIGKVVGLLASTMGGRA